jgi:DNA-binding SARP family transcriptional activator
MQLDRSIGHPSPVVRYRVLGALEVTSAETPVELGGVRQQIALAALLLEAGRVVPVDRLVQAIWDLDPPVTAKEQVQNSVSTVRRLLVNVGLPRRVVAWRTSGYVLGIEQEQLDSVTFNDHVGRARANAKAGHYESAAKEFRSGLSLWRGAALSGMPSRIIRTGAAQLDERRLAAAEECIDLELRLGMDQELVDELSALVAEYPYHERLRAHLMLALYRSGRQVEALEIYRGTRELFTNELGLEPSEELRQLHQNILANRLILNTPTGVAGTPGSDGAARAHSRVCDQSGPVTLIPRQLPPRPRALIGRKQAIDYFAEVMTGGADRTPGQPAICLMTGKAGVGKTALAVHLGHVLSERFPDGQLYADLGGADPGPVDPHTILARFLAALGVPVPLGRHEREALYRSRLADRRVLVVLDDVASVNLVRPLIPAGSACAVLLTSRMRLAGVRPTGHLDLDVLTRDDATEMLKSLVGGDRLAREKGSAAELVDLCARLPLAIEMAGVRLAAKPHWPLATLAARLADRRTRLDELSDGDDGVRPNLRRTYQLLDAEARLLYRRMGLCPASHLTPRACAALAETSTRDAQELVEELVDVRLVDPVGKHAGAHARYRLDDLSRLFAWERAVAEESSLRRAEALARAAARVTDDKAVINR